MTIDELFLYLVSQVNVPCKLEGYYDENEEYVGAITYRVPNTWRNPETLVVKLDDKSKRSRFVVKVSRKLDLYDHYHYFDLNGLVAYLEYKMQVIDLDN